jgi:hypothetical protein
VLLFAALAALLCVLLWHDAGLRRWLGSSER